MVSVNIHSCSVLMYKLASFNTNKNQSATQKRTEEKPSQHSRTEEANEPTPSRQTGQVVWPQKLPLRQWNLNENTEQLPPIQTLRRLKRNAKIVTGKERKRRRRGGTKREQERGKNSPKQFKVLTKVGKTMMLTLPWTLFAFPGARRVVMTPSTRKLRGVCICSFFYTSPLTHNCWNTSWFLLFWGK